MVRLKEKYEQALYFRKRGFSYSEIVRVVGVSKGTISAWFRKKAFSKKVTADNVRRATRENVKRLSLLNKAKASERRRRYAEAEQSSRTEFRHFKKDPLFAAGLVCYSCCGDKKESSSIRLTSTDVFQHALFVRFAKEYLGVAHEEIRCWLLLYENLDEQVCKRHWSAHTKLKATQFRRSQRINQRAKNAALQHGTGNTIIGSTVLKKKLLCWLELLQKEILKSGHG